MLLLMVRVFLNLFKCCEGGRTICWFPSWQLGQLVNSGFCLLDEPVDCFAGPVVAESVLNVVELNGGVGGEADAAVSGAFGGADFAVSVFATCGPYNVAALNLDDFTAAGVP